MQKLLYKEFNLSIHKFYFIIPFLTGALFLIPQWPFFLALMYFFFISVPNILSSYNSQNDNSFSIMMPVKKSDIVKSKILAFTILELTHLATGVIFALLNIALYKTDNFLFDPNPAFFGIAFTMYGLFNIILFPMYFKTAYSYGIPTLTASITVVLYITAVELLVLFNGKIAYYLEGGSAESRIVQWIVLIAGIIIFAALNAAAARMAAKRFEKVNL